jgi:hypothetical protein
MQLFHEIIAITLYLLFAPSRIVGAVLLIVCGACLLQDVVEALSHNR